MNNPLFRNPAGFILALLLLATVVAQSEPLAPGVPVSGWTLLSDSESHDQAAIATAEKYQINHLQLSHHIVHDLREIKSEPKAALVNRLVDLAHQSGIPEVVLWDHALYDLKYYPAKFRTGPKGTLDLDNADFWEWFKQDYRSMLDRVPNADGIVLTFIETGAQAENQFSQVMKTDPEKIAAVVNAVADVVIGERHLNLYARTFAYSPEEYERITSAVALFSRPEIRLMMKETPHDFFLTHPDDAYVGKLPRPTLVEFDPTGEFNGQGTIANTWPEYILRRWRSFATRPHVIGYTARTDRYGETTLIGKPGEINLLALFRGAKDPKVTAEEIYDEFITDRYGAAALAPVKAAFKNSYDIVTSTLYTLGTNTANHSALNYDPYLSSYLRHVSGRWLNPPVAHVAHGVNREFHYWKDVINHIAPPFAKASVGTQKKEASSVLNPEWILPGEQMTDEWLREILVEKDFGVGLATESVRLIDEAKPDLKPEDHEMLHHYFQRTLLTAKLHRAVAAVYFGFRIYCRGEGHQNEFVNSTITQGLADIALIAPAIRSYPSKPAPGGQWNWVKDADQAELYVKMITKTGWPKTTAGFSNPNGGMKFPEP